jgi:5'-3' exonuclease
LKSKEKGDHHAAVFEEKKKKKMRHGRVGERQSGKKKIKNK